MTSVSPLHDFYHSFLNIPAQKAFIRSMNTRNVVVLGASPDPDRYSYKAVLHLQAAGWPVLPLGTRRGEVGGISILNDPAEIPDGEVHTLTLYMNAARQRDYYDRILQHWKPQRIIFNPGAENPELMALAQQAGTETLENCTLVMLALHQF